jgi:integrase
MVNTTRPRLAPVPDHPVYIVSSAHDAPDVAPYASTPLPDIPPASLTPRNLQPTGRLFLALDADQFAAHLVMQGLAENSIRCYRACYCRWCAWAIANDRDPHQPDPLSVRAWSSQLVGSRSVIAHARATIGHLCAALGVDDVSAAIPLPRQPRRPSNRALDHDRAVRLAETSLRMGLKGTAVLVGLYSFARREEIASLAWENVRFEASAITFVRSKNRDIHTVPLHPALHDHLYQLWVPGERWVFPGRHGGHVAPATIWQWVLDVAEGAGIGRVTPHQLRHTALTDAYEASRDLRAVQDLAGHTDPSVTARYTRRDGAAMAAAVGSLNYEDVS